MFAPVFASVVSLLLAATPAPAPAAAADPQHDSLGADWSPSTAGVHAQVREGRIVPLSQVVATVARRIPGHILDAGIEPGENGRQVYRVRWAASDGRRIDVIADAVSGAIIRQEGR